MTMNTPPSEIYYPSTSRSYLRECFLGKHIEDLPTPAAILDEGVLRRNCERMLQATKTLGVGFRPHVKTHKVSVGRLQHLWQAFLSSIGLRDVVYEPDLQTVKARWARGLHYTTEITQLQLGPDGDGMVVVSTVREAESLTPLIEKNVVKDILYGLPLPPSAVPRLSALLASFPDLIISVLTDHPSQFTSLLNSPVVGKPWPVFIKLDMGTHRAGVDVKSETLKTMLRKIREAEQVAGSVFLKGFYCHAGHSYGVSGTNLAFQLLNEEFEAGRQAVELAKTEFGLSSESRREWTISVGATPTAMALASVSTDPESENARDFATLMKSCTGITNCKTEVHAGVYTMLDLQQLSTHIMPSPNELGVGDLALSVLAEVVSIYPNRGENGSDEALIGVGTIGLGREPGKEWAGWGAVSNWGMSSQASDKAVAESGWIVGRISQEHGILTENEKGKGEELEIGMKVRVWPQHACIAGSGYGWYFVVDKNDTVVDVWVRWRGW